MSQTLDLRTSTSWGFSSSLSFYINNLTQEQKIDKLVIYTAKFTNPDFSFYDHGGNIHGQGTVTGSSTVTAEIQYTDAKGNIYKSNSQTITGIVTMRHDGGGSQPYSSGTIYATADRSYEFYFNVPVIVNPSTSNQFEIKFTGTNLYNTGVTIRESFVGEIGGQYITKVGTIQLSDVSTDPTNITIGLVSGETNYITNITGASRNSSFGIYRDSTCKYKLNSVTPSNSTFRGFKFVYSNNHYVDCVDNGNQTFTVSARSNTSNINYPTYDTVKVYAKDANGNAITSTENTITIRFYEKPEITLATNETSIKELNIRTINNNIGFNVINNFKGQITNSNYLDYSALFFDGGNTKYSFRLIGSNYNFIPLNDYISLENDDKLFKFSGEGNYHNLKFRVYNKDVQSATTIRGTYRKSIGDERDSYNDNIVKVKWYITPNLDSQFSVGWSSENIQENIVILKKSDNSFLYLTPYINKLGYTNTAVEGGYCRGFRIELIDLNGNTFTKYYNNDNAGEQFFIEKNFINDFLNDFNTNQIFTIRISCYFYYNSERNQPNKYHYGVIQTLNQKVQLIDESSLLPQLVFPEITAPMMLTSVERFGYAYPNFLVEDWFNLTGIETGVIIKKDTDANNDIILPFFDDGTYIGSFSSMQNLETYIDERYTGTLKVNDYALVKEYDIQTQTTVYHKYKYDGTTWVLTINPFTYLSSNVITNHLIFDIGRFVRDNNIYTTTCRVIPYLKISGNTITKSGDTTNPNVLIDTSKFTLWYRDLVDTTNSPMLATITDQLNLLVGNGIFNGKTTPGYLDSQGNIINFTNWYTTDYISVDSNKMYAYLGISDLGVTLYFVWYDKDKQFISSAKTQTGTNKLKSPINAKYIRFSLYKNETIDDVASFKIARVITQGEAVEYHDAIKFMNYINKYKYLYSQNILEVPENLQGRVINVSFWTNIANSLKNYSDNMLNWATDVMNSNILWASPEFRHKSGSYININNLYQNYYDLLLQLDARNKYATHYYLGTEKAYTHRFLGQYTHKQIRNKEWEI